jgi:hypothetical protein
LRKDHSISDPLEDDDVVAVLTILELQVAAATKRPAQEALTKPKVKRIRELALGYVLNTDSPFTSFDDPFLKAILAEFDTGLAKNVALGRTTITEDLDRAFQQSKSVISSELRDALTSIHISFDLWTSPNNLPMLAVFGHFIDRDYRYQARLLSFRTHQGSHSGENIANSVKEVVKDWEFEQKIGTAMSDNAKNNDTCLMALYPHFSANFNGSDIKHRRMRCFGHILNLVAKAFLFGDDSTTFEITSDVLEQQQQEQPALEHWRKMGPVGKLHNIVKFIRASPQRMEAFRDIAREDDATGNPNGFTLSEASRTEFELKQNNATRWNSTYLMIERAWGKQSHISAYLNSLDISAPLSGRLPREDRLEPEDWRLLGRFGKPSSPSTT